MTKTRNRRVILRVEGNDIIGYGHFVRCLTIARYLKPDFECVFSMSQASVWSQMQLAELQISCTALQSRPQFPPDDPRSAEPWPFDLETVLKVGDILVLDGYRFDSTFHERARYMGVKTIRIVDDFEQPVDCDAIITQLPVEHAMILAKLGIQSAWTGLDGFLVRPEFYKARDWNVPIRYDYLIYSTTSESETFYASLMELRGKRVLAITNQNHEARCKDSGWETAQHLNAADMAAAMKSCASAILPASTIAIEFLTATDRIPLVAALASNQEVAFRIFCNSGAFRAFDSFGPRAPQTPFVSPWRPNFTPKNLKDWFHGSI